MATEYTFGLHAVEELLRRKPKSVSRLWLQKGRDDGRMQALLVLASNADVPISRLPRAKLDELVSGRHQGVVAELGENTAGQSDLRWSEAQLQQALSDNPQALVLVLDGVTDPHNLGACLRSADAAGVTAVVVPKDNAADITAVVRKVACGATETVPLVRVTNLARSLDTLKAAGVWIYGTAGEAGQSLYATQFSGPIALVMGAEGAGMRRLTRERCDFLISLPMAGAVSSLNVSVATGVSLFEIRRQRLLADGVGGL
ncbi:23S rRNA (guanosine(2251)-2'-O)-methyltransferase RlmB [Congregibacter brevis]|uniref:23S rRNA (guanosine-2'-O-)-methyltransferase RlmB n=1 Tax=Congregibacter brevis TaxID=3081201 RepID=A0ABZ0IBC2_9GAMM|nr:23S rRNA (guanosine(2251)-2'-O)-methyltransferase RlmB [Congregibacter sp. IMCC45268]